MADDHAILRGGIRAYLLPRIDEVDPSLWSTGPIRAKTLRIAAVPSGGRVAPARARHSTKREGLHNVNDASAGRTCERPAPHFRVHTVENMEVDRIHGHHRGICDSARRQDVPLQRDLSGRDFIPWELLLARNLESTVTQGRHLFPQLLRENASTEQARARTNQRSVDVDLRGLHGFLGGHRGVRCQLDPESRVVNDRCSDPSCLAEGRAGEERARSGWFAHPRHRDVDGGRLPCVCDTISGQLR